MVLGSYDMRSSEDGVVATNSLELVGKGSLLFGGVH